MSHPPPQWPNLGRDALNASASPGATTFPSNEWCLMHAFGWNLSPASDLTTQSVPSYVA